MAEIMHVCVICGQFPPAIGGIASHCKWLVDNLKNEGVKVSVITRGTQDKKREDVWEISSNHIQPAHLLDFGNKAKKIIEKIEPDIVHVHSPGVHLPDLKTPMITTVHTTVEMEKRTLGFGSLYGAYVNIFSPVLKIIENDLFRKSDKIIAVSGNTKNKLINNYLLPKEKVRVIHNGVPDAFFKIVRRVEKGNLLFVGNLIKRKNIQILLKAMVELENEFPDIQLNVVGNGPYKNKLENLRKKLNLERVNFVGNVNYSRLNEYFSKSDALILPSKYEDFPMVILESLACGLPVIASRVGGIPEIISDEHLFSPDNPDDVIIKISSYLKKRDYAAPLIDLTDLSGKAHISKFIELYQSVFDRSARKPDSLGLCRTSPQLV